MPMLNRVGQKSWGTRCVVWSMYAILLIGAVSMIYPLLLMLSYSVKSQADFAYATPLPRYLYDDHMLWVKYLESKYGLLVEAEKAHHEGYGSYRLVTPPAPEVDAGGDGEHRRAERFMAFRAQYDWPLTWYRLGHLGFGQNARRFRGRVEQRYDDDLLTYSDAVGVRYKSWSQVIPPQEAPEARRHHFPDAPNHRILDELKIESSLADRALVNPDAVFWHTALRTKWPTIEQYNEAHGTDHLDYDQVLLPEHAPLPEESLARADWEEFVRYDLNLPFIRIDPVITPSFRSFLEDRYEGDIGRLNELWGMDHAAFSAIELPDTTQPLAPRTHLDVSEFLKDPNACSLDAIRVFGPRQAFEQWLVETGQVAPDRVFHHSLPIARADYADFQQMKGALRWEFLKRNYVIVLDYILLHGNGVRNTIIYCALLILATLTVNPLAAYALSRYKPPSAYKILLFCMCTMAFPPEVTMIPAFLLLKRFPLIGLAVAAVTGVAACWIIARLFPKWPDAVKGIAGGAIGLVCGFYVLPALFGEHAANVSLLNTFWALVLPAAANGFGIFLLKGFFDSLPQELYEAAEIDGAGEFTKFWTLTMSLSKPILAVLALTAFTTAYGEFMIALVIIPDPDMWTLMIWLFQLQSQVPPWIGNAALVLAAIPTFLVFLFCQNIIMKGIVVPVEK